MNFFDKIKDVKSVNGLKQFLGGGSNKILVVSVTKFSIFNKDVLGSEWTLTSRALGLVCT